jgi:hypothetical protein
MSEALSMSTNWRDEAKALEQRLMAMQDQYAELARALGSPVGGFWGDPTETHAEILRRAERLRSAAQEVTHRHAHSRSVNTAALAH